MVGLRGLEPLILAMSRLRSNQLSHNPICDYYIKQNWRCQANFTKNVVVQFFILYLS